MVSGSHLDTCRMCVCECTEHFLQYGLIFNVVESLILEEFGLDILEKIKLV